MKRPVFLAGILCLSWLARTALLGILPLLAGCGNPLRDHALTVRSGLQLLSAATQIEQLFGESDHFITHFGFSDPGPRLWNTEVFFGGRFSLTMQVDVEVDYQSNRVVRAVAPAQFYLRKIQQIQGNRADIEQNWQFGEAEWKKLFQSNGDWAAIGISLGNTNALPNFSDFVLGVRSPRAPLNATLDRVR